MPMNKGMQEVGGSVEAEMINVSNYRSGLYGYTYLEKE